MITAHGRSFGQGNVYTPVCLSFFPQGVCFQGLQTPLLCLQRGLRERGEGVRVHRGLPAGRFCFQGGLPTVRCRAEPPGTRKMGRVHPTGMLSCLKLLFESNN